MFTGGIKEIKITKNNKDSPTAIVSPPPPEKRLI
jgi:hypothetical protein